MPDLGETGQRQEPDQRHAGQLGDGDDEEDQLLRDPVGNDPRDQGRKQDSDRPGGRRDGQLGGTAADPDDLPHQGHGPGAEGEGAEHQRQREATVGRRAERRQRAWQRPARPLVADGVDQLVAERIGHGLPPSVSLQGRTDTVDRIHRRLSGRGYWGHEQADEPDPAGGRARRLHQPSDPPQHLDPVAGGPQRHGHRRRGRGHASCSARTPTPATGWCSASPSPSTPIGRRGPPRSTRTTFEEASAQGSVEVRVLEDRPAAHVVEGQVRNRVGLIITLIADAILLAILLLVWRARPARPVPIRIAAIGDVERCPPGGVLEQIEGDLYLVRGRSPASTGTRSSWMPASGTSWSSWTVTTTRWATSSRRRCAAGSSPDSRSTRRGRRRGYVRPRRLRGLSSGADARSASPRARRPSRLSALRRADDHQSHRERDHDDERGDQGHQALDDQHEVTMPTGGHSKPRVQTSRLEDTDGLRRTGG